MLKQREALYLKWLVNMFTQVLPSKWNSPLQDIECIYAFGFACGEKGQIELHQRREKNEHICALTTLHDMVHYPG